MADKTIFQLSEVDELQSTDIIPIARPGSTDDLSCTVGQIKGLSMAEVGNLAALETASKTSIVDAINEIFEGGGGLVTNRVYDLVADKLKVGDFLVYDKLFGRFRAIDGNTFDESELDTNRYDFNGDVFSGVIDGMAHFVAANEPTSDLDGYCAAEAAAAAAPCHYRILIDNTKAGSITFSVASGNGSIESTTLTWAANSDMDDIVALFTALNNTSAYIVFGALEDGQGVGLSVGGYGANTLTVTEYTADGVDVASEKVLDCTTLATIDTRIGGSRGIKYGDTYDPARPVISSSHKNWRGATAQSILGSALCPVGANSSVIGNTGKDYSYRTFINYAGGRSWASTSGDATFYSDGVNGSTAASSAHVMNKATFDANVNSSANPGSDAYKMYLYYSSMLFAREGDTTPIEAGSDITFGDLYTLREQWVAWYQPSTVDLYALYIMAHSVKLDAASGIVFAAKNKGNMQAKNKGMVMTVDYNLKYYPAYGPEYNVSLFGKTSEKMAAGFYYHPEPADLALIFRDDNMAAVNTAFGKLTAKTLLTNSSSRGSAFESSGTTSWCFYGTARVLSNNNRYYSIFSPRPVLALPLYGTAV